MCAHTTHHDVDAAGQRRELNVTAGGVERGRRELRHGAVHSVERVAELQRARAATTSVTTAAPFIMRIKIEQNSAR